MAVVETILRSESAGRDRAPFLFAQCGQRSLEFEIRRGASVVSRLIFSSEEGRSAGAGPTGREWLLERSGTLGPFITAWRRGRRAPGATVRPDGWGGAAIRTEAGHALMWVRRRRPGTSSILTASDGLPVLRYEISPTEATLSGAIGVKGAAERLDRLPFLASLGLGRGS